MTAPGDHFEVFSAGTKPSQVWKEAITVLRELGIDISSHRSRHVDEFQGQPFDCVVTVCNNAKESCPYSPGTVSIHRRRRDQIRAYFQNWPFRRPTPPPSLR